MASFSRADLEARFGVERIQELEAGRPEAVSAAIQDTVARVDMVFKGAAWPQVATRIACDIAMYYLGTGEGQGTEAMKAAYDAAIALLQSFAEGDITTGGRRPAVLAAFSPSQIPAEFGQ